MEERDNNKEKQNTQEVRFTSGYQDIPLHFRDRPDGRSVPGERSGRSAVAQGRQSDESAPGERQNGKSTTEDQPNFGAALENLTGSMAVQENRIRGRAVPKDRTGDVTGLANKFNSGFVLKERTKSSGSADDEALRGLSDETREVLKQMYAVSSAYDQGSRMDAEIFYQQGRIVYGLEDYFPIHERYQAYYPTYRSMTLRQLREYLTWRTVWRKFEKTMLSRESDACTRTEQQPDQMESSAEGNTLEEHVVRYVKNNISFAYMHAYELINNTDDIPAEEGYRKLAILYRTFGQHDGWFRTHLWRWLRDFAVYYQVDPAITLSEDDGGQAEAIHTLEEYERYLRTEYAGEKMTAVNASDRPDLHAVFRAICCLSSRDPSKSPYYRKHAEDLEEVCVRSYAAVCRFYMQNGKRMLLETMYGGKDNFLYYMFQTAVFYDRLHYDNYTYAADASHVFVCHDGRWTCERYLFLKKKDPFLGDVMREAERDLRDLTGYTAKLTKKIVSSTLAEVIAQTVEAYLEEKREAARPKVHIQLDKLGEIRQNAVHTRNQLIVDDAEFVDPIAALHTGVNTLPAGHGSDITSVLTSGITSDRTDPGKRAAEEDTKEEVGGSVLPSAQMKADDSAPDTQDSSILTPAQKDFLRELLAGGDGKAYVHAHPELGSVSLLADDINEALFDQIGDTVIEVDGDTPTLINDYREDVENCCR